MFIYVRIYIYYIIILLYLCGSGSSVGITTDCGLDGPGSNHSGFPSIRINLSPFTQDFRGGEHMMSL